MDAGILGGPPGPDQGQVGDSHSHSPHGAMFTWGFTPKASGRLRGSSRLGVRVCVWACRAIIGAGRGSNDGDIIGSVIAHGKKPYWARLIDLVNGQWDMEIEDL